jgi:nucleoid-associated protein YgaU
MTSDAKIGLLLGLVFIFIIAFIINGLPSFRGDKNNNELTTNMVGFEGEQPGLGGRAQEVIRRTEPIIERPFGKVQTTVAEEPQTRFEMLLPDSTSVVKDVLVEKASEDIKPAVQAVVNDMKQSSVNSTWQKIYVVADGDTLADIAMKFYGAEKGNKIKNIAKIFEANRKLLKSADEIYVGQKLEIPPLPSLADTSKMQGVFPKQVFEKVDSIGQRQISTTPSGIVNAKQSRIYVVREGDSLWRIAAEQLGNGDRYPEMSKLNTDILEDEDTLEVGMKLRLPER